LRIKFSFGVESNPYFGREEEDKEMKMRCWLADNLKNEKEILVEEE
jgi:hypothetical protein